MLIVVHWVYNFHGNGNKKRSSNAGSMHSKTLFRYADSNLIQWITGCFASIFACIAYFLFISLQTREPYQ